MKEITIKDIIKVTNGKILKGNENEICKNFKVDSRKVEKDDTYIGLKGEKVNGSIYWKEAILAGAKILILQNVEINLADIPNDVSIIMVEDTVKALGQIAKLKRSLYDMPVIGITGSVGKTSTKDIIANVVSQKYKTLKTEGNFNNNIGLPLTILNLEDHEVAVIEMGMNHEGEIRYLSDIAKPTIAVITNIGTSHIGNLGSRENILKAKLEILEAMKEKKIIINNDNDMLNMFYEKEKNKVEIITFGTQNESKYMPQNIEKEDNSISFEYEGTKIKVPIGGEHYIYNALAAIAVGKEFDIEMKDIKKGIETFELTKRRMDIEVLKNGAKIINDTYNASYESMKAAIKYLDEIKEGRKIAVLGDMFELGEYSKELHEKVGAEVAKSKIDLLICIGEDAKYIEQKAKEEGKIEIKYFKLKEDAVKYLKENIQAKDNILIKASNGMKFFEIVEDLKKSI